MKLQCDLCREIVVADFEVGGAGITVHCPACKQAFEVAATRKESAALPRVRWKPPAPDGDEITCAKCGEAQPPGPACRRCGLLAEKMASFERDRDAAVPAEVTEAWQRVEERWTDGAAHERFMDAVAASTDYAWAAQRYRSALRDRPDDPRATDALARLTRMAEATLMAGATRKAVRAPTPYRNTVILLVALVVLIGVGVVYALVATGPRDEAAPSRPVPSKKKPPAVERR